MNNRPRSQAVTRFPSHRDTPGSFPSEHSAGAPLLSSFVQRLAGADSVQQFGAWTNHELNRYRSRELKAALKDAVLHEIKGTAEILRRGQDMRFEVVEAKLALAFGEAMGQLGAMANAVCADFARTLTEQVIEQRARIVDSRRGKLATLKARRDAGEIDVSDYEDERASTERRYEAELNRFDRQSDRVIERAIGAVELALDSSLG